MDTKVIAIENWDAIRKKMLPFNKKLFAYLGGKVRSGPFQGMYYENTTEWDDGNGGARLIGSYEVELHSSLALAVGRCPETVVNVGASDGYYAIGLARMLRDSAVYALDTNPACAPHIQKMALRNNTPNVSPLYGCKSPQSLDVGGRGRHLFVMDVEGAERQLLDPLQCPLLKHSDIIVECHDFFDRDHPLHRIVGQRFIGTHDVYAIFPEIPNPNRYPFLNPLPLGLRLMAVTNWRPMPTAWLACFANNR